MLIKLLPVMLLPAIIFVGPATADSVAMIQVTDLRDEARLARDNNLVLVLEFSSEYCGYCRKLEDLFLVPMQRNAEYDAKILIRSVSLDSFETLVDFDGRSLSTAEFASRYEVSLTPTLLFLNAEGKELSEKLVGIWSEDFYGGFIDGRIDQAREKLRHDELTKAGI
ncbi:MAG: thioredoxin fold domain-containing protein [Gammaproteobacteria bacterium]|nr:thioredoxin fold domain-containing protein [Gammaproteobacteria bacterium]